jgi:hypothetical protein
MQGPSERIEETIQEFKDSFPIEDLGLPSKYLGCTLTFNRRANLIHVSQSPYIDTLASKLKINLSNNRAIPMTTNADLSLGALADDDRAKLYRSIIGGLMWLARRTRPDICYSAGVLARYSARPTVNAYNSAIRVVKYLASTRSYGIVVGLSCSSNEFPTTPFLHYVDASFADHLPNARSTGGQVSLLWGTPVDWSSRVQGLVTLSTMESELVQLTEVTKQCHWLRKVLNDLRFPDYHNIEAMPIMIDNSAAIQFAHAVTTQKRTKHINIRYHFVRDSIAEGTVVLRKVESSLNIADIFTKPLAAEPHSRLTRALSIIPLDEFSEVDIVIQDEESLPGYDIDIETNQYFADYDSSPSPSSSNSPSFELRSNSSTPPSSASSSVVTYSDMPALEPITDNEDNEDDLWN